MRPRKHQCLGEMQVMRVPNLTASLLPSLIDVMEKLETNGRDSVDILSELFDQISDTL